MKKKILIIAVAASLLALTIAGTSVAYFTDTEKATNVFTAGDVNITLTYANGVAESDDNNDNNNVINLANEHVYPGQVFDIDATITNVGSEDAYVGAIITLKDTDLNAFVSVAGEGDNYPVAVSKLLDGLVADGGDYKVTFKNGTITEDETTYATLTIYIIKTDAIATGRECKLFNDVVIPTKWDNAEMKAFSGLELSVVAYATQTGGFETAVEAFTAAFGADFGLTTGNN